MPADDAIRCDACPVLCYIKPGRTGSCDRYANHDGNWCGLIRILFSIGQYRVAIRSCRFSKSARVGRRAGERRGNICHRDWRGHDLSRLQARAFYYLFGNRRRGYGHGRDRRDFQLLRSEGKDRYRPASGPGVQSRFEHKASLWAT